MLASGLRHGQVLCSSSMLDTYELWQQQPFYNIQSFTDGGDVVLQVVCSVSLAEGAVPCDVQFDPLSKQYLLLLCRNGSMALYGISEEQHALSQVRQRCQLSGKAPARHNSSSSSSERLSSWHSVGYKYSSCDCLRGVEVPLPSPAAVAC
jgi:hypothetical protein